MSTNYYLMNNCCPTCGHTQRPRHIGLSAMGWAFLLHVYPEEGIHDWDDWEKLLRASANVETTMIKDEYGNVITFEEMCREVTERKAVPSADKMSVADLDKNQAFLDNNKLMRSKLIKDRTIRNGAGTWDCCIGDFS